MSESEGGRQLLKQYATLYPKIFDIILTKQAEEPQEGYRPIKQISPSMKSKAHIEEVTSKMFFQKSIQKPETRSNDAGKSMLPPLKLTALLAI